MARSPRRTFLVRQARKGKGKRPSVTDEQTAYYWWWQFLRRNDEYLQCCERNGKGRLRKLYGDFGDVRGDSYRDWLYEKMPTGETRKEYLFAEAPTPFNRPSVVTLQSTAEWDKVYEDHGYLLVAVNMRERSLGSLKKQFDMWLRNEPRAPNIMTAEERQALIDRRRYEYVVVDGKRVRKRRPKKWFAPLPRKERMAGKRGRKPLAIYKDVVQNGQLVRQRVGTTSTARYPIWQNYAVDNLRDMLAVVEAVEAAEQQDLARRNIKLQLIPLRKRLAKVKHYQQHKLIAGNTADGVRVKQQLRDIYEAAQAVVGESLSIADIEARLEKAWENRRNKETTSYPEIGKSLIQQLGWREGHSEGRNRWLTKKMNELYTRGKAVIANTAQGKFPKDS